MIDRFFVHGEIEGLITIQEREFHHLAHVMRLKVGDTIELINGEGQLAKATIQSMSKKEAQAKTLELTRRPTPTPLILAQALVRRQKLEWVLEKGCELGITHFWLYPAEKGEKAKLTDQDVERLQALLIAALKQSGRLTLPKIEMKPPLLAWNEPLSTCFFGDVREEAMPLFSLNRPFTGAIIGPESGFSKAEVEHLEKLGAKGAKITDAILRTESAALAAAALLSHRRLLFPIPNAL